jgi:catechol 2,3-dioxygenase-like lactoylglutathione lyase family enzyme
MNRHIKTLLIVVVSVVVLFGGTWKSSAQTAASAEVTGLIGYMVVPDALEKSLEFYHNLLGLQQPGGDPRAKLKWYGVVPFLTDMYGVHGNARNFTLQVPGAEFGVEPMQWSESKGKPLQPRLQDPGASQLMLTVNDIDELLGFLTKGGVKVITTGGKPVPVNNSQGKARVVVVQDFHGYYVHLVQPDPLPPLGGANGAGPPGYIMGGNVAITVQDTEKAARFYRDVLGLKVQLGDGFSSDASELAALGMKGDIQYRHSIVMFPGKSQLHLVEFKNIDRKPIHPGIVDQNAVVLRVSVRGIDALYNKMKASQVPIVSVSGAPYQNGQTRWLMVHDPDNIYVQPVERPPAPRP